MEMDIKDQARLMVFKTAVENMKLPPMGIHGVFHWMAVYRNALLMDPSPEHDHYYWSFAVLHDCCRDDDGADAEHGYRASRVIDSYDMQHAIRLHSHVTDDKMAPRWVRICWDADALDIVRLGIKIDPSRLRTDEARLLWEERNESREIQ